LHQSSPTCLAHLERNRYSVPASFADRPVSLHVYPERIVVVAEGQVLCEHKRIIDRYHNRQGQAVFDWRHYLAVIQRKPGALRNRRPPGICLKPSNFYNNISSNPGGDR
jgi:hypothetical protein